MTKFKSAELTSRIKNAIHGIKLVIFSEKNFLMEIIISILVIFAACILKFNVTDICILIIMCAIVLICELFNSAIEYTIDAVYKNKYSLIVKMAKDISAGTVFFACFISIIIGIILFGTYLLKL